MRLIIALVAALSLLLLRSGGIAPADAQTDCGGDRADVQTLTDPNAGDLDTAQLIGVNLSTLASLPIPEGLAPGTRYNPYETTIWATRGQLTQAALDPDGAIDVTLSDPDSGDTLTAVFPDALRCAPAADPDLLQAMEQARQTFVQAFGTPQPGGTLPLSGIAVVAGVGFIPAGRAASQGGSGSGIELSPVLGLALATAATTAPPTETTPAPVASATPLPSGAALPAATPAPASATPGAGG
jgi:hypothetical protein